MDRVDQWLSESGQADFHPVALLQINSISEAENICAKKVKVRITRTAVAGILEVMMFQIRQGMGHMCFSSGEGLHPNSHRPTHDFDGPARPFEIAANNQLRPNRTGAEFGVREV
jgi:hypothetical protein